MRKIAGIACSAALVSMSLAALNATPASAAASRAAHEQLSGTRTHLSASSRNTLTSRLSAVKTPTASSGSLVSDLPLAGFGDVVADPTHGHVFVSGGPGTNGVTVADSNGNIEQTLANLPGADGMTLSPDGSTLYVALIDGAAIAEINTSTLAGTSVATGDHTCPATVAVTASTLWFGYGNGPGCSDIAAPDASVGSVESNGTVHLGLITVPGSAPILATSPGADGVLLTAQRGGSALQKYTVAGGSTPTATYDTATDQTQIDIENLADMAMTPDGADVVVASGFPYVHQVFKVSDLTADGTYPTTNYPDSVAINADGVVAAGVNGQPGVFVFQPGASSPSYTWTFADGSSLVPSGLAFAGTNVYAVTRIDSSYRLFVFSTLPDASVTVNTDKTAYRYAAAAHVTVTVPGAPSDSTVTLYARILGTTYLVKSGHPFSGTFTASPKVGWKTTFFAGYSGDSTHGPTVSRGVTIKTHARVVSKLFGSYAKSHGYYLFHKRRNPRLGAAVAPNHAGECLYFVAQRPVSGHWRTYAKTGCVTMTSDSAAGAILTGTHRVGERVRLRAEWRGDPNNLAQNGAWQKVRFTR